MENIEIEKFIKHKHILDEWGMQSLLVHMADKKGIHIQKYEICYLNNFIKKKLPALNELLAEIDKNKESLVKDYKEFKKKRNEHN